jgi:hypothetical protein
VAERALVSAINGRVPTQHVEGLVEATNANGLKIAGAWVNVSRFRPVELPEAGTYVRLEVDSRGYIRELEVLKAAAVSRNDVSRSETITRLAVLEAAAAFAAGRTDIKSTDVLQIADRWLAWVERQ